MSLLNNIEDQTEFELFRESFFNNGKEGILDFVKYIENSYEEIDFTKRNNFIVICPSYSFALDDEQRELHSMKIVICVHGQPRIYIYMCRLVRWGTIPPGEVHARYSVQISTPHIHNRSLRDILGLEYRVPSNRYFWLSKSETQQLIDNINKIRVNEYFRTIK
jgi:hypothetical protein